MMRYGNIHILPIQNHPSTPSERARSIVQHPISIPLEAIHGGILALVPAVMTLKTPSLLIRVVRGLIVRMRPVGWRMSFKIVSKLVTFDGSKAYYIGQIGPPNQSSLSDSLRGGSLALEVVSLLCEEFSKSQVSPHLFAPSARKRIEPSKDSWISPWLMRPGVLFVRLVVIVLPRGALGGLVEEVGASLLVPDTVNRMSTIVDQLVRTRSDARVVGACRYSCRLQLALTAS